MSRNPAPKVVIIKPKAPAQGAPAVKATTSVRPKHHDWDSDGADMVVGIILALVLLIIVLASWAKMNDR